MVKEVRNIRRQVPPQWADRHHRADAAHSLCFHRNLAGDRLPRRRLGIQRHLPLHRAHGLQAGPSTALRKKSPATATPSAATWTPSQSKECICFNVKVLDEHVPVALEILSDLVLHPIFDSGDITRERGVILEEIKMDEDNPDYLVHEIFTQNFWKDHPLGQAYPRHQGNR